MKGRQFKKIRRWFTVIIFCAILFIFKTVSWIRTGFSPDLPAENNVIIEENLVSGNQQGIGRHLLASTFYENCTPRAVNTFPSEIFTHEERSRGAVAVHILIALYVFGALTVVCDDYFVGSLEVFSGVLKLHEDVAGATLMAIGSSAPELFTSIIGLFLAENDIGVGAIVGSAVFNLLFTIGVCGLFGGMVIHLAWWPMTRDCGFYLLTLCCLILVMFDSMVYWYESLIMIMLYILYMLLMHFNSQIGAFFTSKVEACRHNRSTLKSIEDSEETSPLLTGTKNNVLFKHEPLQSDDPRLVKYNKHGGKESSSNSIYEEKQIKTENSEDEEYESPWTFPESWPARFFYVIMFPVKFLCFITIPDCRRPGCWKKLFLVTFITSIIWIAVLSYVMVWMVTVIGDTWDIPDTVMGVTLLAVGSSVPDALSSIIVARQGLGAMAVSNPIGSNIFDILICLGLPWFLQTVVINTGSVVYINSAGLTMGVLVLFGTVAFIFILIILNRWKINKIFSLFSVLGYIAVTIILCLFELNIFGYMNPPPCQRIDGYAPA